MRVYFGVFLFMATIYSFCNGIYLNREVERIIDLRSHLVKISNKIYPEYVNGPSSPYIFTIPLKDCEKLAFISVTDVYKRELFFKKRNSVNGCEYLISFNKTSVLYIETIFSKLVRPHPKKIVQSEAQLVKYSGNIYFYSSYKTRIQRTVLQLSSKNLLHYSLLKPMLTSAKSITYGPYENIQEYAVFSLDVHYENQSPFLTVTHLERTIEVSHWGNIAVEEKISLLHSGATLKSLFSRYELQKDMRSEQSVIKSYKTLLPAAATSVYYRDMNGNISTSDTKYIPDAVELELRPRFSLLGGWISNYILGYNVPSFEYLFNQDQTFLLKMRIIDHIFDEMIIDQALVKIILPEGSSHIELFPPFFVARESDTVFPTYLDTFGRPVISFRKRNLVENHIGDFSLKYTFSKSFMLQEPALIIGFIFTLFVAVIVFVRLDFSISGRDHHKD